MKQTKNTALSRISALVLDEMGIIPQQKRALILQSLAIELLTNSGLLLKDSSLYERIEEAVSKKIPYFSENNFQKDQQFISSLEVHVREACQSVVDPLELGWLYQKLREVDRLKLTSAIPVERCDRPKESEEIALLTQTFTDDYIVSFLLENSFKFLEAKKELTICDPACGAGHFLILAYRKTKNLKSIYGFDIDQEGVELAKLLLLLEAKPKPQNLDKTLETLNSQIRSFDHKFGTLKRVREERRYSLVITNPPYIARRKMHHDLVAFLDFNFPAASHDLCAAFIQRSLELVEPGGVAALLTMNRWLTLDTYESVRIGGTGFEGVLEAYTLKTLVDLGSKALAPRQTLHDSVRLVMSIIQNQRPTMNSELDYLDLSSEYSHAFKAKALESKPFKKISQATLKEGVANEVLKVGDAEWLSKLPRVQDLAEVVVGIQTNDDAQFVKFFWEVPKNEPSWITHHKGGGNGRWFGQAYWLLDMSDSGKRYIDSKKNSQRQITEHVAKPGWCYSWLANGVVGLRQRAAGSSIGRAACSGVYFEDQRLAAVMNSRVFSFFANKFSSKAQLPEGVFKTLPLPASLELISVDLVQRALELKKLLCAQKLNEPTHEFSQMVCYSKLKEIELELDSIEQALDSQVVIAYKLPKGLAKEYRESTVKFVSYETTHDEYIENLLSSLILHWFNSVENASEDWFELDISGAKISSQVLEVLEGELATHIPDLENLGNRWLQQKFLKRHTKEFFGKPMFLIDGEYIKRIIPTRQSVDLPTQYQQVGF